MSSEPSRRRVHALRDRVDAILVGANTVARDDPRLTTRLPGGKGRSPVRIVLDSRLRLPARREVFRHGTARTVVATTARAPEARARALARKGVEVWRVRGAAGRVDLRGVLQRAAKEGLLHVLVEGGAEALASAVRGGLADELWLFLAPKLVGASGKGWLGALPPRSMRQALELHLQSVERVGPDVLVLARWPAQWHAPSRRTRPKARQRPQRNARSFARL